MKKRKVKLFISVVWFLTAGCWIVTVCADLQRRPADRSVMLVHALTAVVSLAAAFFNLFLYKKENEGI